MRTLSLTRISNRDAWCRPSVVSPRAPSLLAHPSHPFTLAHHSTPIMSDAPAEVAAEVAAPVAAAPAAAPAPVATPLTIDEILLKVRRTPRTQESRARAYILSNAAAGDSARIQC
jgi:hypothetical protein